MSQKFWTVKNDLLTKLDLSLRHHFKKPLIMIGTYCLNIIPTDRSTYFFSLFQRSKMKIIIIPSATQWITWCRTIWLLDLPAKRPILSVRRLGLVTFSRNFPRIFQEIHISLSISPVLNQLSLLYTSQCTSYRLFAYYGDFNLNLAFFFSQFCVVYFFFGMIPHTPHVPHNIYIFYLPYTCFAGIYSCSQVPLKLRGPWFSRLIVILGNFATFYQNNFSLNRYCWLKVQLYFVREI